MTPYYQDDAVTLYFGDCREIDVVADVVVTDPPYPNNGGHFDEAVEAATEFLSDVKVEAIVFWSELTRPPIQIPLVAVHIWHRANVNGRPYEPAYHFAPDGIKRRSDVFRTAVEFENATGAEYLGHPTQKNISLMQMLLGKTEGSVLDPFAGTGSTLRAAKNIGRRAIGIEIEERYCEIAARRCAQEVLNLA